MALLRLLYNLRQTRQPRRLYRVIWLCRQRCVILWTMSAAEKIIEDALTLPASTRAKVAGVLLDSLAHQSDDELDNASWVADIKKRAERVFSGHSRGRTWSEVRERLEAQLKNR